MNQNYGKLHNVMANCSQLGIFNEGEVMIILAGVAMLCSQVESGNAVVIDTMKAKGVTPEMIQAFTKVPTNS